MEKSPNRKKKTNTISKHVLEQEMDFKVPDVLPLRKKSSREVQSKSSAQSSKQSNTSTKVKSNADCSDRNHRSQRISNPSVNLCDVTSDFAEGSGCTPYKRKNKLNAKKNSRHERKNKHPEKESETKKSSEEVLELEHLDDAINKDEHEEPSSSCDTSDDQVICYTCKLSIPRHHHSNHIKICLREKFKRNGSNNDATNTKEEDRSRFILCQVCQEDISDMSVGDKSLHMNNCLDGKTVTWSNQRVNGAPENEAFLCQICQKDLTKWTVQRRTQHINRCIDQGSTSSGNRSVDNGISHRSNRVQPKSKPAAKKKKVPTATLR